MGALPERVCLLIFSRADGGESLRLHSVHLVIHDRALRQDDNPDIFWKGAEGEPVISMSVFPHGSRNRLKSWVEERPRLASALERLSTRNLSSGGDAVGPLCGESLLGTWWVKSEGVPRRRRTRIAVVSRDSGWWLIHGCGGWFLMCAGGTTRATAAWRRLHPLGILN
jgi:hypothetical protein